MITVWLFAFSDISGAARQKPISVYFIPFDVQTYSPITQDNIKTSAWEIWNIKSDFKSKELIGLLKFGNQAKFDKHKVRALIICDDKEFFLDSDAIVSTDGDRGERINKDDFLKFRASLDTEEIKKLVSPP